jgi:OOP family OmpA-OmpF porin
MRLHDIQFDFDRDAIKEQSQPILDIAVNRLKECPEVRIVIGGHTDSVGSDGYNVDLSYRRAVATRDYFVQSGIDGARLGTEGFGEADPIAPNETPDGRALNRRVELAPLK